MERKKRKLNKKNVMLLGSMTYSVLITLILIVSLITRPNGCNVEKNKQSSTKSDFAVHFIDVGQADSILVTNGGKSMLIDAGNREDDEAIKDYLAANNVVELEYIIGTHAHEDHIGGMASVMQAVPTKVMMLPDKTATTKTYINLLETIEQLQLEITVPKVGEVYQLGDDSFQILWPESGEKDTNNSSIVIRYVHIDENGKETSFMFTGDVESDAESKILALENEVSADVLKVGHHGSSTSTSSAWLKAIAPKVAVISCGDGNDYGHPHDEIVKLLEDSEIDIYRTDTMGSIVVTVLDGKVLVNKEYAGK